MSGTVELLTVTEVADRLRVSRRTVERFISRGQLRPIHVGARTLITSRELDAYVLNRQRAEREKRRATA